MKYDKAMCDEMRALYLAEDDQQGRDAVVQELHERWEKPIKSIIAKMSKEGYYIKKKQKSKVTKGDPMTKEEILRKLNTAYLANNGELEGLQIAPKRALLHLLYYAKL